MVVAAVGRALRRWRSMTGGIMPKLSAVWWPVGVVAALLLIAGVSMAWSGLHASRGTSRLSTVFGFFGGDEYGGERRELELLQAALQRIEAELRQQANAKALASLRTEQEAVMHRVREVASRVPADSLSPDIRRLLQPETAAAPTPGTAPGMAAGIAPGIAPGMAPGIAPGPAARRVEEAAAPPPQPELRVGLPRPAPVADFSGLALEQRPPWPLFSGRKPPHPAAPADRKEAQQSSR